MKLSKSILMTPSKSLCMSVMPFKEQLVVSASCDMLGAVDPTTMSVGHIQVHTKLNLRGKLGGMLLASKKKCYRIHHL